MRLTVFPTVAEFLAAVRPVLAEHEAEHHLVLGAAEAFAANPMPRATPFAAAIDDEHGTVLVAWMEESHPLLLTSDRGSELSAVAALVSALRDRALTPSHVIGEGGQAEAFVGVWTERTGWPARLAMRQRAYRLDVVPPFAPASGHLRPATLDDADLVASWQQAFAVEALGRLALPTDPSRAARRIVAGEIHLWCEADGPKAMAGSARATAHGIAVNAVYTPPEWRGRGYATACVAELSRRLLGSGFDFCVLYTDLGNRTSNSIYTRIGYRPVRDFLMYDLRLRAPSPP